MTHYETLGVEESATIEEIRTAYRRRLREAHPDRGGSQEDAQRINAAYEALGTPEARAAYDRRLDMQRRGIDVDTPHMAQPRHNTGTGTIPPEMWDLLTEVLIAQARAQTRANAGAGMSGSTGGMGGPRIVFGGGPFGSFGEAGPSGRPGPQDRFRAPRQLSPREVWSGGSTATRLRAAIFVLALVGLGVVTVLSSASVVSAVLPLGFLAVMAWLGMSGSVRSVNAGLPTSRSIVFLLYLGFSGMFGIVALLFGQYAGALGLGFANLAFIALAAQTYTSFTFSRLREVMRARMAGDA